MFALSWSRDGTDNCWATKCGCKIEGPSFEKLKQKRNSRKVNTSKRNIKIIKKKRKQNVSYCIANSKKQRRSKELKNRDSPKSIKK